MTEIWLVRHGETEWNREQRFMGQQDIPLNRAGLQQAADLAVSLRGQHFNALYSSDLLRARQTAEALAAALKLPLRLDARLREVMLGVWQGQTHADVQARYPLQWAERYANPPDFRPPAGETIAEMAARAYPVLDEIAAAYPRGLVLLVSHGILLAALICRARGLPLALIYAQNPANARPEIIDWPPEKLENLS
ncbi:fructose-2,6-bisphosphatase [Longilinea arvoryzae]|uniref:Fructose-2,6-bisphosphatase n=1 Tax=Longilinea arvoryzae TaxID=360412 RepID=A0A0S7BJ67_9CHLR|nr:histidine phosphatase family protein [Longilinea arvoryzae]GAP13829.1 fructose-2,6-bisphosphatase [Longilinea arvoryzae]